MGLPAPDSMTGIESELAGLICELKRPDGLLESVQWFKLSVEISNYPEPRNEAAVDNLHTNIQPPASTMVNLASNPLLEHGLAAWDFTAPSYPLESFDLALEGLAANTSPVTRPSFTATEPSTNERFDFTPPNQMLSDSITSRGVPGSTPLTPSSVQSAGFAMTLPSSPTIFALVRLLSEYPSLLRKGSFTSPFLHTSLYALYNSAEADMAYLPLTSMAICCASGINISTDRKFVRRAINAARQRLIGTFPCDGCIQQFDALHAMLIYESLEMGESIGDEETWRLAPPVKGLGSHFLLKVCRIVSSESEFLLGKTQTAARAKFNILVSSSEINM
ncbi:MAG: hypothetical protein Q9227_001202 [Pyrenula ochraceoflavens]